MPVVERRISLSLSFSVEINDLVILKQIFKKSKHSALCFPLRFFHDASKDSLRGIRILPTYSNAIHSYSELR